MYSLKARAGGGKSRQREVAFADDSAQPGLGSAATVGVGSKAKLEVRNTTGG